MALNEDTHTRLSCQQMTDHCMRCPHLPHGLSWKARQSLKSDRTQGQTHCWVLHLYLSLVRCKPMRMACPEYRGIICMAVGCMTGLDLMIRYMVINWMITRSMSFLDREGLLFFKRQVAVFTSQAYLNLQLLREDVYAMSSYLATLGAM